MKHFFSQMASIKLYTGAINASLCSAVVWKRDFNVDYNPEYVI
jgi:hypothetical protein